MDTHPFNVTQSHYRLRAIRGVPFRSCQLHPTFYCHPNISDTFFTACVNILDMFVGDKLNLFNLTFHEKLFINLKKGRDELVDICPLSTAQIVAIKYLLF